MTHTALRMNLAIILFASAASTLKPTIPSSNDGHQSGLAAKTTMPDGIVRVVRLDGVFRKHLFQDRDQGQEGSSLTLEDRARCNFQHQGYGPKQGHPRDEGRLATGDFSCDRFRVLYVTNASGSSKKIDLADIRSVEFVPPSH